MYHVDQLTQEQVAEAIASNQSLVCWTVGRTVVIRNANRGEKLGHAWLAGSRRFGWSFLGAFLTRGIRNLPPGGHQQDLKDRGADLELGFYRLLSAAGGCTLRDPDKMIDSSKACCTRG